MNNADKPVMPLPNGADNRPYILDGYDEDSRRAIGLTKREHFASMAMQGLVTEGGYHSWLDLGSDAVAMADALLEALEA